MTWLLICGPPGVGKSTFCQWLSVRHHFVHVPIDDHPEFGHYLSEGSACALAEMWRQLPLRHPDGVVEWGFPPGLADRVARLQENGMQTWWFDGDKSARRAGYLGRSGPVNLAASLLE